MKLKSFTLFASFTAASALLHAQQTREWNVPKGPKRESQIGRENTQIRRNPVTVNKSVTYKKTPNIFNEDLDLDRARQQRANQKTAELIGQIRTLIKRERQRKRLGELKMRLAELYYAQAGILASRESESWVKKLKQWEALSPEDKAKYKRPDLQTPKADRFRRQTLTLYAELERASRGPDQGRSQMIRRDDVLFYLASTYLDLNQPKKASPHFFELTRKYPNSPRAFQARLNLADIYFESGQFRKALPEYLIVVRDAPKQKSKEAQDVQIYAMYKVGWCYYNGESFSKAITAFQRTVSLSRNSKSDKKIVFEKEALSDLARAFAMAGKYSEGEKYYKSNGDKELLSFYQQTAAQIARDKGHFKVAQYFYGAIIRDNPYSPEARDIALTQADLLRKHGKISSYAKTVDQLFETYGANSRWLDKQDLKDEEEKVLVKELVDLSRREAKNLHNLAQRRKGNALYFAALPLYSVYFKHVPDPNVDDAANVHEMRFYYAELLYKIKKYPEAALAYEKVGEGKYASVAAYNRILSYREAAAVDKKYSKKLIQVTQEFVEKYPNEKRAGDLLYAGAFEAFKSGSYDDAMGTLQDVVRRFPGTPKGVESAERILFIHEKQKNYDKLIETADEYSKNQELLKAGGAQFVAKLRDIRVGARFKKLEAMPEATPSELSEKSKAFLEGANSFPKDLKEKALNNSLVFAKQANDKEMEKAASAALLAAFPASEFAKNVYLQKADAAIAKGEFVEAQKMYRQFLQTYKKDKAARERAEWNDLYIQIHLENQILKELLPRRKPSPALVKRAQGFLATYPSNSNRAVLMSFLLFRNGVGSGTIDRAKKLPRLSSEERNLIEEAEAVLAVRSSRRNSMAAAVKRFPPAKADTPLMKAALARASFSLVEPNYARFQKLKLDFNPYRFAGTLKRKLGSLENLEKEYLNVVSYGDGEYALKSLQRIASLYYAFASEIGKSTEAKEELEKNYAAPLREKGLNLLRDCFEKAVEYRIGGAGLNACRQDLARYKPDEVLLQNYLLPNPTWLPSDNKDHERELMKVTASSFEARQEGKFLLGVDLMEDAKPAKTLKESSYIDNMSALLDWTKGLGLSADRGFNAVASRSDSGLESLRVAAMKNLAALRLQVGDVEGAWRVLSGMSNSDEQVPFMKGLARAGAKDFSGAVEHFDESITKRSSFGEAWFNKALALKDGAKTKEAIEVMDQYVAKATPPLNHVSRRLLSTWRSQK